MASLCRSKCWEESCRKKRRVRVMLALPVLLRQQNKRGRYDIDNNKRKSESRVRNETVCRCCWSLIFWSIMDRCLVPGSKGWSPWSLDRTIRGLREMWKGLNLICCQLSQTYSPTLTPPSSWGRVWSKQRLSSGIGQSLFVQGVNERSHLSFHLSWVQREFLSDAKNLQNGDINKGERKRAEGKERRENWQKRRVWITLSGSTTHPVGENKKRGTE